MKNDLSANRTSVARKPVAVRYNSVNESNAGSLDHKLVVAASKGHAKDVGELLDGLEHGSTSLVDRISTAILAAARGGHLSVLQTIVGRGYRIVHPASKHCKTLHAACSCGKSDVICYVIQNGGNLFEFDRKGWTCLHVLADQGFTVPILDIHHKGTKMPLNHPTKKSNETPLIMAVKKGYIHTVRALLKIGAATDVLDIHRATPLYIAARDGNLDIVKDLLGAGAPPDQPGHREDTPIIIAARKGQAEVSRMLLDHDAQPAPKALLLAAQHGRSRVIQELLSCGATPETRDFQGMTPLFLAAQNGHAQCVQVLIDGGAQVDTTNSTGVEPVYEAVKNGHEDVVKTLLNAGARLDSCTRSLGLNLLHAAAQRGHVSILRLLLSRGISKDAQSKTGETAIFWAVRGGHVPAVVALLDSGIDSEEVGYRGQTALHVAAKYGRCEIITCLVKRGAGLETRKVCTGETALFIAACAGLLEATQLLLKQGAQVDAPNKAGKTPLTAAVEHCHLEVAKALINHGARTRDALDSVSATVSKSERHREILTLLTSIEQDAGTAAGGSSHNDVEQQHSKCRSEHLQDEQQSSRSQNEETYRDLVDSTKERKSLLQTQENRCSEDVPLPIPKDGAVNKYMKNNTPMNGYNLSQQR